MATQHSTQKQKTITLVCNQPGGAVARVSPRAARIAMELDTMNAEDRQDVLRVLRAVKAGLFPYSAAQVEARTPEQRQSVINSLPGVRS